MTVVAQPRELGLGESVGIALLVHLLVILVLGWNIRGAVLAVPVRTLQIHLGSPHGEAQGVAAKIADAGDAGAVRPSVPTPPPAPLSTDEVERMLRHTAAKPTVAPERSVAKQYLRPGGQGATAVRLGSEIGNVTTDETTARREAARYEQLLSLWVLRHRVYPADARAQGISGQAMVRIRIDRHGNLRRSRVEQSSGSRALDAAALDMVRDADPMPPVPDVYPGGDALEFLIPVIFGEK